METFRKGTTSAKIKVMMENLKRVFLITSWKGDPMALLKFDCLEKKFFINALRFWSFISLSCLYLQNSFLGFFGLFHSSVKSQRIWDPSTSRARRLENRKVTLLQGVENAWNRSSPRNSARSFSYGPPARPMQNPQVDRMPSTN